MYFLLDLNRGERMKEQESKRASKSQRDYLIFLSWASKARGWYKGHDMKINKRRGFSSRLRMILLQILGNFEFQVLF